MSWQSVLYQTRHDYNNKEIIKHFVIELSK